MLAKVLTACRWPGHPRAGLNVAVRFASAKQVARRKKERLQQRFAKVREFRRKQEGDFPVSLRPVRIPEVRDLETLEETEETEESEKVSLAKAPAPKSAEALENAKVKAMKEPKAMLPTKVPNFNLERDLPEEDGASLQAYQARGLAKRLAERNYKYIPNPYSDRPGSLGTDAQAEAKYYTRYFDGTSPKVDHTHRTVMPTMDGAPEDLVEPKARPKRKRISAKRFWIQADHVTPDPQLVAFMSTRELKFAMMNEAHLVRKWRSGQAKGQGPGVGHAPGLPVGASELWMALGYRAAELACGRSVRPLPGESEGVEGRAPVVRCSLQSTLRFLQAMASVQAGPQSAVLVLVNRVLENVRDLKPHQGFYILQAMSRLRLKHPKAGRVMQHLSLAWRSLAEKNFVKSANAVAKLDLSKELWAKPLKMTLATWLAVMAPKNLMRLKAIAVMELLDDEDAMRSYLQRCERDRSHFWYSRHLQMVELHVHLLYPKLWESLEDEVRLFLQEVRNAAHDSTISRDDEDDEDDEDNEAPLAKRPNFDRKKFNSELHQDLSRILGSMSIPHQNKIAAGPMVLDIHLHDMCIVEASAAWSYYLRSSHLTALARRRQEMLKAMGFDMAVIPYFHWEQLKDDDAKREL